ncbi:hypothetical protein O181_054981 [Austropuccinia psidii MF-1]|uniref:Uncharacterized protein n=1 Tax=Austropuccinia psidii MF-1 TaxID=1389203 RepID=A0A9Q3E3I7_9BASI|nr:hypothetical protein [Austropuccinia psidii MF-1]
MARATCPQVWCYAHTPIRSDWGRRYSHIGPAWVKHFEKAPLATLTIAAKTCDGLVSSSLDPAVLANYQDEPQNCGAHSDCTASLAQWHYSYTPLPVLCCTIQNTTQANCVPIQITDRGPVPVQDNHACKDVQRIS